MEVKEGKMKGRRREEEEENGRRKGENQRRKVEKEEGKEEGWGRVASWSTKQYFRPPIVPVFS